jgi:dienelactone hydrolase
MRNLTQKARRAAVGVLAALAALFLPHHSIVAQTPAGVTLDHTVAPGANYDKAAFRLWYPSDAATLNAVVVLMPGSNGDGRPEAADPAWQTFAARQHVALVGCRLTDKPHDQGFIEEYVDVSKGSGQALLDALASLAVQAKHPEIATVPLLLWGMSAGGEFNYEFVAWKPERVIAFVVNKGGIYYTALAPRAARNVPGMLFIGGKDLESRVATITGIFAVNRRAGALWALAEEPGAAHIVGRSRDVTMTFFEDVMALRIDGTHSAALKALTEKDGFLGDRKAATFAPAATLSAPNALAAWLPTERVARAWQAMLTSAPFAPGSGK